MLGSGFGHLHAVREQVEVASPVLPQERVLVRRREGVGRSCRGLESGLGSGSGLGLVMVRIRVRVSYGSCSGSGSG